MSNDSHVVYNDPNSYVQIGCDYLRISRKPDARGVPAPVLMPWKFAQIKRDFSTNPEDIKLIPRYEGMGCYPDNINYKESVGGFYNTYHRLTAEPAEGSFPSIECLMHHIFGDQFEEGMDYLQLLYMNPTQHLPIILLVSKERGTGKTTFLNMLKAVFGGNMAFATNESMREKFNSDWAGKVILGVDETLLNRREDSERLKALSTARKSSIEFKGKDRYEIDNHLKLVLCSNNIDDPVFIERGETRYWVRHVPRIALDDPELLEKMEQEIPALLYHLQHRQMHCPVKQSRMWFRPEDLDTPALQRIINHSCPSHERELAEILLDFMAEKNVDELCFTTKELRDFIQYRGVPVRNDLHQIVCKSWGIEPAGSKSAYDFYYPGLPTGERRYGRYRRFTKKFLETICPPGEVDDVVDEDLPEDYDISLF